MDFKRHEFKGRHNGYRKVTATLSHLQAPNKDDKQNQKTTSFSWICSKKNPLMNFFDNLWTIFPTLKKREIMVQELKFIVCLIHIVCSWSYYLDYNIYTICEWVEHEKVRGQSAFQ